MTDVGRSEGLYDRSYVRFVNLVSNLDVFRVLENVVQESFAGFDFVIDFVAGEI